MKSSERKKHTSWKNLPSFFDVSGSVSVATFGARRLPEIKALWAQVEQHTQVPSISAKALESGGGKKSSRHLRRRTTSYKRRIRHRFPAAEKPPSKSQCRKARRRRLHMREYEQTPPGSRTDEPSVHWIANHIWHAKRFHMCNLWDWRVPMLHINRGAKAALRLAQERTLVQEATWCQSPILCMCSDVPLLSQCLQRVIPSFSVQSSRDIHVGSGVVHEVDSFPKRALGPATWIWMRHGNFLEGVDNTSLVLLVHPCIQQSVLRELGSIVGLKACVYTEQKLCCLRLRGFQPDVCLKKAGKGLLSLDSQKELGAFVSDTSFSHFDAIQLKVPDDSNGNLLIAREATHDSSVTCNLGVLGFDVYCSSGIAKSFFQSLVLAGGAAPIGLTEWSHLLQEAHPPVPIFPRDWPDTPSGVEYWQTDGIWSTVRRYLEGGSGRVNPCGPPLRSVLWPELTDELNSENVVVVRSADFGKPFEDALAASGSSYNIHETSQINPRRSRRSSSPFFVSTPKLSLEDAKAFFASCNALIQSLTLPALILCHITVFGKGVIGPNDKVFFGQGELGVVTSGSFSPARGQFHGIAIIGASRFLSHVAAAVSSGSNTFAVRECDGKRSIQLGVSVRRGDQAVFGTLALILYANWTL